MNDKKESKVIKLFFQLVFALGLLVVFCSCQYTNGADLKTAGGLELRVMTFNIRYGAAKDGDNSWENRRQMVFDVLQNQDCDIIGLQEALLFQIAEILKAIPQYAMVGVGRDDGKTQGEYCAILYDHERFREDESGTFWLSDTPEVPGSITWGNACTRICTWVRLVDKETSKAFYVYNLHLDHVSQPSREKSAALLAKRINSRKHDEPFVVTGDFNVGEDNPVMKYLKGQPVPGQDSDIVENPVPMVDTFRVLHPDATEVGTFNEFKGDRQGDKIDYILTPPDVKVLEAQILHDNIDGRYPSDHFPVTARLVFIYDTNSKRK